MDEEQKTRTIDQFNNWCDHCRIYGRLSLDNKIKRRIIRGINRR